MMIVLAFVPRHRLRPCSLCGHGAIAEGTSEQVVDRHLAAKMRASALRISVMAG